jgi:DNA polymerase III alpha subunit (gram-positive type)
VLILAYDLETTGVDKQKDRMIEVGLVLYSTGQNKILESTGFLVQSDGVPVTPEITELTHITQEALDRFGYEPSVALNDIMDWMSQADAVIGHNVIRFDKPITDNTAHRLLCELPSKLWIDTMTDLPRTKGEQLITMCAKKGFCNPHQHSAEDDAKATLKLATYYDFGEIVERAKSPTIVVQSHQGRHENDLVKKMQFRWNPERKWWWRPVKEMDLEELKKNASFPLSIVDKQVAEELLAL